MRLYTSMHAVKAVTAFIVMPETTCGGLLELYLPSVAYSILTLSKY